MDKEILIKKTRSSAEYGTADGFLVSQVETEISRLEADLITIDVFKINISILLQIVL